MVINVQKLGDLKQIIEIGLLQIGKIYGIPSNNFGMQKYYNNAWVEMMKVKLDVI